eukprot:894508_1
MSDYARLFDKERNECVTSDYTQCDAMQRLINSSKHYSTLKMNNQVDSDQLLIRSMDDIIAMYNEKRLIDDYIHFKEHHEHELERINRDLVESNKFSHCCIVECEFTRRHMHEQSTCTGDTKVFFYGEILDALHFHLFHCFEAGLRVRIRDPNDEMEEEEKATNDQYFDAQFSRMSRRILERHGNTASFDRFSLKNTKFNIVNEDKLHTNKHNNTYLDELIKHLLNVQQDEMSIKQFMQFINQQQYDTDAIEHDHAIKLIGNISARQTDEMLLKYCTEFIADKKRESSSFSIGFRFYYWPSYKGIKELIDQDKNNVWDHSGYPINELFIEAKYASFKQEIAHYKFVTFQQYQTKMTVKVNH